jgi:hypothetical protein
MKKALLVGMIFLILPTLLLAQFQAHVDYAAGADPFGVAAGDFNGDGDLDLAVTNNSGNTVSVLLGNGDGMFKPHVDYATGSHPESIIVQDFNNDGKLDLAIANCTSGTISILLGKGDGTFQPHVDYAAQTSPQFLVAGDFNGDGKLDLAVANYGPDYSAGSVSVFLGKGDGTFEAQQVYGAGINPFGIMTGDFDHDSKLDLAVVNNNGIWGVSVLLGNGDGSFRGPVLYVTGANPRVGVVGDFNGDGNLDLAVGDCIQNSLSVLMGDGLGQFSSPTNYATGNNVQAVAGGDFDLDGKLDLVATNQLSNSVSVLLGNGDGTFQSHVDYATDAGPMGVVVADLNGDGLPDLATANISAGTVSVLLNANRGTGTKLVSALNPANVYQLVTYTATVTSKRGTETGTVAFKDGGLTVATVPLANHQASFATRYSEAGSHAMTATYSGDDANSSSTSPVLTQLVEGASVTLLMTSGSPTFVGQPVTFTATVTSKYGTIGDGGLVSFYDGTAAMASVPLAGGVAVYTTTALSAKSHGIRAVYAGSSIFKASTGRVTQVVNKYASTTVLASSRNPAPFGWSVALTATVKSGASGVPSGAVVFTDGTVWLGKATLNASGVATLTTAKLVAGSHSITATYNADWETGASASGVVVQTINQASTSVSIVASRNPSTAGQTVKFTATVTSPTTTLTGSVTFMDGGTALGTVNLAAGKASYSTSALSVGTHNLTAVYSGTANIRPSTSPLLVQIVN